MTGCPMTNEAVEKNGLTDKQVKAFCDEGCSVICGELFDKYSKRIIIKSGETGYLKTDLRFKGGEPCQTEET